MTSSTGLDSDTRRAIERTRARLDVARHLPGVYYTSREIFEREIETIFMREWLCVGRVEEFERAGDYHAMRIAGEPLVVCRDRDGRLHAFRNLCRHRGVREFAAFLQPENTRTSDKFVFEVPCNWKFVPENLTDMYQVGVIHRASFGGHFPVNDFRYNLTGRGYNAVYESYTMAPNGVTLFGPMPWLEGRVSDKFACTTWIRPTMNIFGRHDLIQPWVALPLDVNRTEVTIYTQLPEAFFDEPGFAEKNRIYADFIRLVATEDEAMLESLQTGMHSRGFEPGPTVNLERAIHHLQNYYLDRLLDEDETARAARIADGRAALERCAEHHPEPCDGGYSKAFGHA